jgi:Tol biopolymer transport system component
MVPAVSTSTAYEKWLAVCTGSYFLVARAGDLYEGQLGQAGTAAAELNSTASETSTYLSPDCLTTYFASARGGTTQLYTATRTAVDQPWTTPVEVTDADDAGATTDNEDPWISPDLRTFVFASNRGGTEDVYITTR